jgi:hypothetical protein
MALATTTISQTTTIKLTPWQQCHNLAEPRFKLI